MNSTTELPYILKVNPLIIVFGSLFLVIVPFIIWANFAHLEQRSTATGVIITTAKVQKVQAPIDGVIDHIYVSAGDIVKKGDILFYLEKEQNEAAVNAVSQKIASLEVRLVRLEAESHNKPLLFAQKYSAKHFSNFVDTQKKLHALRQKTLNDKISSLRTSLDLQVKELELNMPLVEQGDIGANTIIKMKGRINEIRGEINSIINNFRKDAQEELTRLTDDLVLQQEILIEKKINLSRSDIKSKMDAIVKDIVVTTAGAKVRSGDVILELVPIGTELIIQAKLKPADIALVKEGQKAYIKFDAFDFTIFGLFMGTVEFVSPDTIKETTSRGQEFFIG